MAPKLTIGTTHFDDFTGLWATIQSLRLYHADVMDQCELLIIDNHPDSPHGKAAKDFAEGWAATRWIPAPEAIGTAPAKDRVFREARGDAVLYLDCHVLVHPGAIAKLLRYYEQHPDTTDLLSGPMVYDNLKEMATHFDDVWRDEMWGVWGTDKRGLKLRAKPFEIPAMGMGLCSCRREAWVGFNPRFRGFGGEEFYIHEKFRQAGAKCMCLPFLRWTHRFGRPQGVPFPLQLRDKVRNFMIGHRELGTPLDRLREHFVGDRKMPEDEWLTILEEVDSIMGKSKKGGCGGCGEAKVNDKTSLQQMFDDARQTPSDINEHCEKLRELSAQCEHVTEFGMRHGVSTVALLAGQPGHFVTYDVNHDPMFAKLARHCGETTFTFHAKDVLIADIVPTDMLFIDTKHTESQLTAELARHASKVRRWIVLHDTAIYGKRGEDGGPGLLPAMRRFMRDHPEWSVMYHTQANNGLTVISRDPRDKPGLPGKIQMAKSLVVAVADHVADSGKKVSTEQLQRRLERCTLCEHRIERRCAVCGCFVDVKASWRSSECPLGKWATHSW